MFYNEPSKLRIIAIALFWVATWIFSLSALTAIILMFGWNMSMPYLFGMKYMDFWQALGLALVANVIIGAAKSNITFNN